MFPETFEALSEVYRKEGKGLIIRNPEGTFSHTDKFRPLTMGRLRRQAYLTEGPISCVTAGVGRFIMKLQMRL